MIAQHAACLGIMLTLHVGVLDIVGMGSTAADGLDVLACVLAITHLLILVITSPRPVSTWVELACSEHASDDDGRVHILAAHVEQAEVEHLQAAQMRAIQQLGH